jgi:uncharacterized protein YaiI (UPF0178 family)
MTARIIVDANAGPGTPIWQELQRTAGLATAEYVLLSKLHRAIPDVEILGKLMQPGTVLVTADRVLHMRAIRRGFRSYTLNEQGQITRQPLAGVPAPELPRSVHAELPLPTYQRSS